MRLCHFQLYGATVVFQNCPSEGRWPGLHKDLFQKSWVWATWGRKITFDGAALHILVNPWSGWHLNLSVSSIDIVEYTFIKLILFTGEERNTFMSVSGFFIVSVKILLTPPASFPFSVKSPKSIFHSSLIPFIPQSTASSIISWNFRPLSFNSLIVLVWILWEKKIKSSKGSWKGSLERKLGKRGGQGSLWHLAKFCRSSALSQSSAMMPDLHIPHSAIIG